MVLQKALSAMRSNLNMILSRAAEPSRAEPPYR